MENEIDAIIDIDEEEEKKNDALQRVKELENRLFDAEKAIRQSIVILRSYISNEQCYEGRIPLDDYVEKYKENV